MEDYIGEIRMFAGDYAPQNWAICDGRLLSVAEYSPLFSLLGNQFGGDGYNTFALPDLRGRCPVSSGNGASMHWYQGMMVGTENQYIGADQLPAHSHQATPNLTGKLRCSDNLADHVSPVGNTLGKFKDNVDVYNSLTPDADMHDNTATITGSINISSAGGNQAHPNMQPSLAINYIICAQGLYPQRQ